LCLKSSVSNYFLTFEGFSFFNIHELCGQDGSGQVLTKDRYGKHTYSRPWLCLRDWSLDEKLRAIMEIAHLSPDQESSYLREKGLYEVQKKGHGCRCIVLELQKQALNGKKKYDWKRNLDVRRGKPHKPDSVNQTLD
jgi:hypothetical protein